MADCVATNLEDNELIIPASPNWYCATATLCNNHGLYAFAAKNQIFVFDISQRHPRFINSFQFYKDRITSVCWILSEKTNEYMLAFGGEDGILRIFDVNSGQILGESKKQNGKISAMVALEKDSALAGNEKGLLICWNYDLAETSAWLPVPSAVFSMAIEPKNSSLVAIGYANGHVLICDARKQKVIQHYKSHLDEVQSLTWQPCLKSLGLNGTVQDSLFVASGSKDKTIRVWDIEKDHPILTLNIPSKHSGFKGRRKVDDANRAKIWITLCWHKKDVLISSSISGELLVWDLKTKDYTSIAPAHNRMVFNITHDCSANKIISTSMDRQIMFWDGESYELLTSLPSIGGYVYSIAASYLDPFKIIYGVGDNLIRVWNTRYGNEKPYDTNLIWQGIKSKVTVVVGHPSKEGLIGFGTDDGHVGVYNISSGKYEVSVSYHKKTVYSLSWGPLCGEEVESSALDGNCLYSCGGEGTILIHAQNQLQNKAKDMNSIIKKANKIQEKLPSRSDVEWKRDFSHVAIGNDDGSVEVFSIPSLRKVCTILVHRKIINCIQWHHHFEGNTFSNWLATGSSDNYICVSDLTKVLNRSESDHQPTTISEKFRYFNLHSQRITGISWSPHSVELLASSSYDGTVQIWNVVKNEPIANFNDHNGRVLCVSWSLVNPDIIYSGSEDFTLRRWSISKCKHILPPETKKQISQSGSLDSKKKAKANPLKGRQESLKEGKDEAERQILEDLKNEDVKDVVRSETKGEVLSTLNEKVEINKLAGKSEAVKISTKGEAKKKKTKSLLPLSANQNHKQKSASQNECILLAKYLQHDKSRISPDSDTFQPGLGDHVNIGLFADQISAFKMFSSESENHANSGNVEQQLHLELWKGNLGGALKICKENGELNEMIVAMSPIGGYDVWKGVMKAFADQLASKCDYVTAASYYVAINRIDDAIEMFKAQNMFKEAISLAKVRLPANHPVLIELYQLWGERQNAESCYENAAKCYLASGDHKTAIKILARKGDVSSLKTAAQVALAYNETEIANDFLMQCVEAYLTDMNWKEAKEMEQMMEQSEGVLLQIIVHELLAWHFIGTEMGRSLNLKANVLKNGCCISSDDFSDGGDNSETQKFQATKFLRMITNIFSRMFGKFPSSEIFENANRISMSNHQSNYMLAGIADGLKTSFLSLSHFITMGIISLLNDDVTMCFTEWLLAIDVLYQTCQFTALEMLYKLFFPRDFTTFLVLAESFSLQHAHKNGVVAYFHNFHAYYKTSLLFQFWWERFPHLLEKGTEISTNETMIDNGGDHSFLEENSSSFSSVLGNVNPENMVILIASLSNVLLSKLHCRGSQMKLFLKNAEKSILELKIKKQLREHIKNKNENAKKKRGEKLKKNENIHDSNGVKRSANNDENWRERETSDIEKTKENKDESEDMKDEVDEVGEVGEVDEIAEVVRASETELGIEDETKLTEEAMDAINLQVMEKKQNEIKEELDSLESKFTIDCFPNCVENAKILLHIILNCAKEGMSNHEVNCMKLLQIANDIITWASSSCLLLEDQNHFKIMEKRIKSFRNKIILQ